MSGTRHKATDDKRFNQERYCSSEAFNHGLLANLVAKRAKLIEDREDRALVYWLQQLSHREGGMERVVTELIEMFPGKLGTASMVNRFRRADDDSYTAEEIRAIRDEIPGGRIRFRLKGDPPLYRPADPLLDEPEDVLEFENHDAPDSYPVSEIRELVTDAADGLAEHLKRLCVDPAIDFQKKGEIVPVSCASQRNACNIDATNLSGSYPGVWYFTDLIDCLHAYRNAAIAEAETDLAPTEITRQILGDMDYALESRSLVIIEGLERMGKSAAAKNFCRRNPGKAVYVRLESGTDMVTFYRSIARALGTACNAQRKAVEMRTRVEETLHEGDLMLVIDEAHHLFPQARRVHNAPPRMEWVRDMVDEGVPFVLIGTPQFEAQCLQHQKQVGWNARQIRGRVALHTVLPEKLSESDLETIAAHMVPNARQSTLMLLVGVANFTVDYVAAIERVVKRARYFAGKRGAPEPTDEDIERAFDEVVPTEQESSQTEEPDKAEPVESSSETISKGRLKEPLPSIQRQVKPLSLERDSVITTAERRDAETVS